jgi:hypothetical protein
MKKKSKKIKSYFLIYSGVIAFFIFILYVWILPFFTRDVYITSLNTLKGAVNVAQGVLQNSDSEQQPEQIPTVAHVTTPAAVKAIYMSACVAGSRNLRNGLIHIATSTEINSIIIDVKDFSGKLSFTPDDPELKQYVSENCGAQDMSALLQYMHANNIYVIGRVTVFQDPFYTKVHPESAIRKKSDGGLWKDKNGISYIDPGSHEAWDHVVAIAKSAHDIGFDEINFDYIRYPSDGNISDISLPTSSGGSKPEVVESFFSYLHEKTAAAGITTSADLFGMTTTNYDDLGIGQVLERALPYFDYIDPMVYPSHYPANFNGWPNPNLVAYDLIHYVMRRAVERAQATSSPINVKGSTRIGTSTPAVYTKISWDKQKLRPWIQDFNYGGVYGPKEVREQIQASYDDGLTSWLIWNPSNKYTVSALHTE